jgi:lipoprotein-anchoring transpeptidase ErfK/SrfK
MPRTLSFLALLAIVAGCAMGAEPIAEEATTSTSPVATSTSLPTTTTTVAPNNYEGFAVSTLPEDVNLVAMARGELAVYPEADSPDPTYTLPASTILGTVTVVTVVDGPIDGWAKVMLPIRPNGSEGWIKTDNVDLYVVEGRVVVDLSDRELTYYKGGEEVLTSVVAIGTSRNPTPTGHFYITDNVTMANPNSPWGPHAFGLSARSDTITEYTGGDGIVGIHGTNRPGSIGNAASLGCVRLPNDVITQLHELIAIGTPVEIRA